MVDYDLTVQSTPTGVEMKVEALGQAFWRVTNFTETFADGTDIDVIAPQTVGEPQGTTELAWYFKEWENGSKDPKRTVTLSADTTIIATYEQQKYFPTRPPSRRKAKFEGKIDEDVMQLRVTALKPMMVDQIAVTTAQQTRMENLVGKYLHAQDLYGTDMHHYRNFSQELWGLTRLFTGVVLNKEASLKAEKWKARGLDETHLENVAKLFGITITWS